MPLTYGGVTAGWNGRTDSSDSTDPNGTPGRGTGSVEGGDYTFIAPAKTATTSTTGNAWMSLLTGNNFAGFGTGAASIINAVKGTPMPTTTYVAPTTTGNNMLLIIVLLVVLAGAAFFMMKK